MNKFGKYNNQKVLNTCRFLSSVMREIWIFFLPIALLLREATLPSIISSEFTIVAEIIFIHLFLQTKKWLNNRIWKNIRKEFNGRSLHSFDSVIKVLIEKEKKEMRVELSRAELLFCMHYEVWGERMRETVKIFKPKHITITIM